MDLRTRTAAICETLPGAVWGDEHSGELPAWKIGGKLFACFYSRTPGLAVKCADTETARMLIETGTADKAPYCHASWVRLPETATEDELRHRIRTSYDLIRAKLPAAIRRGLEGS